MQIRTGRPDDVPRLLEIYNHFVVHTPVTFDIEPITLAARQDWFEGFSADGPHRLYVAEEEGLILGYASSGTFRARAAYDRSVETSVYLANEVGGRGIGSALYGHLLDQLSALPGLHRAYGGVTVPNEASVALHQKVGFKRVATFSEVGFKFGRYWDVTWFERSLA